MDVDQQIQSVERRIGARSIDTGEARALTISRVFDTPLDELWDACSNRERIGRWFLPVSGDLREGGSYQFEGNAGGTIERCDPPAAIDATWEFGGQVSWIELRLEAEPGGCSRFRFEHIAHVTDEQWSEFGPGAVGVGWDGGLLGLTLQLQGSDELADRDAAAAWQASAEGHDFYRRSSEAWAEASIAAGTDPAEAHAAAARTTGFYTGAPTD